VHRSRLSVLVIVAAGAAACSKHDASDESAILSEDRTLVARLDLDQESHKPALPAACGTIAIPAQASVSNQHQADELTRQARDAEMHGDLKEARSLLRRASELDATNKTAVYHLGRTSEALGDSTSAMTAYCRYLALTPTTAEAVEAHQRVTRLSQAKVHVAAGSTVDSTSTRQAPAAATTSRAVSVSHTQSAVTRRVAAQTTTARRSARVASAERSTRVSSTDAGRVAESPASSEASAGNTPVTSDTAASSVAGGDVVMAPSSGPVVDQPAPAQRTSRRYPSRAQSAGIGAAAGAIIGGVTGRSVKSAVIGAAAGGIFGTVVGGRFQPADHGFARTPSGI
jgi:Glycine zipper